ncbi:calcium-binding protein [Novosphingobium sp.]|uniref:calcium-binding protein n=1 Tax=Novosphingobium sp. TaxID=1874826 RepID=UPI0026363732|nr:calcium-binding protein [Novosphingobium sp.]
MPKTIKGTKAGETLDGSAGADLIYGLGSKDILNGLGGNDLLDGGVGADRMFGGDGDDRYVVDSVSDKVIEAADEGNDLVLAALSRYKIPSQVENLTFTTRASHFGIGNGLNNVITGNSGTDRLFGGGGDDTLIGGNGNDYLSGGRGRDTLLGGNGDDTLNGGAGNDLLDGGIGADNLFGGRGNDIYIVDNARDTAVDVANGGIDEVRTRVDFKLSGNIERLTITGANSADGTGNMLDNALTGNDQRNVLDGAGGNDILDGGKGNDVMTGGLGVDRFVFSSAPNRLTNSDLITDFSRDQKDKIVLSLDVFTDFDGDGRISPDAFHAEGGATRATEDGQFLIYDTASGALYYDAEGPDGRGAIQIAQLGETDHPALFWSDFLIVG